MRVTEISWTLWSHSRRQVRNLVYLLRPQVVVQHVNVQGLGRTKEDLLGYEISDVFHAKNLIDVRPASRWQAKKRLQQFLIRV